MRHEYHHVARAIVAVVGIILCASIPVAGQQMPATTTPPVWEPPRTPDGQPDIQGYWTNLQPADTSTSSSFRTR